VAPKIRKDWSRYALIQVTDEHNVQSLTSEGWLLLEILNETVPQFFNNQEFVNGYQQSVQKTVLGTTHRYVMGKLEESAVRDLNVEIEDLKGSVKTLTLLIDEQAPKLKDVETRQKSYEAVSAMLSTVQGQLTELRNERDSMRLDRDRMQKLVNDAGGTLFEATQKIREQEARILELEAKPSDLNPKRVVEIGVDPDIPF
jgi:chromosome segregation ATPase